MTDLQVVVRGELSPSGSALQGLPRGSERGSAALRGVIANVEINVGSLLMGSAGDTGTGGSRGCDPHTELWGLRGAGVAEGGGLVPIPQNQSESSRRKVGFREMSWKAVPLDGIPGPCCVRKGSWGQAMSTEGF